MVFMRSVVWWVVWGFSASGALAQPLSAPLLAAGYNPDWTLRIANDGVTLSTDLQLQQPPPQVVAQAAMRSSINATQAPSTTTTGTIPPGALAYTTTAAKGALEAVFTPLACTDPILGTLHPYTAEVRYAGARYGGCGGDPAALLQGREWVVEDIAARGVVDRARITLQFGANGELGGRASCNPLEGRYAVNGGSLQLRAAAVPAPQKPAAAKVPVPPLGPEGVVPTTKICPPALRRQDAAFFEVLAAISRWDFTADGALALGTIDGRRIVARRQ